MHNAISQALELSRVTLIYGENGRGKTMFSTVLSSLGERDPERLLERQSIGEDNPPEIKFLRGGAPLTFDGVAWSSTEPLISVFDSRFVDQNVYTGFEVKSDQRKELLDVVLGERGVTLAKAIDEIAEKIKPITKELGTVDGLIKPSSAPLSVQEFIALSVTQEEAIEQKRLADVDRTHAVNAQAVLAVPTFEEVDGHDLDVSELVNLLETEIAGIAASAGDLLKKHVENHVGKGGETWLVEGFREISDDVCPFCGQDLRDASALIDAYTDLFSEEYVGHVDALEAARSSVDDALGAESSAKTQQTDNANRTSAATLARLSGAPEIKLDLGDVVRTTEELRELSTELIGKKIADPLSAISDEESIEALKSSADELRESIVKYNEKIALLEGSRTEARSKAGTIDTDSADRALETAVVAVNRSKPEMQLLCTKREELSEEKRILEEEKSTARSELDDFTPAALRQYETQLNGYLEKLHAGFRVVGSDTSLAGGTPRLSYELELRGVRIPLASSAANPSRRTFSNTLSEGDKRTLALAFFFAKLEVDPALSETVVVVDDPVSSFDVKREHATQMELVRFAGQARQLVVLSHDARFLKRLEKLLGRAESSPTVLEIERADAGRSRFTPCDLAERVGSSYARRYRQLVEFTESGSGDRLDVVSAIRPLVEANLDCRYSGAFGGANTLGTMINEIQLAGPDSPLADLKPDISILASINEFTIQWEHGSNSQQDLTELSDEALRVQAETAIRFARGASVEAATEAQGV